MPLQSKFFLAVLLICSAFQTAVAEGLELHVQTGHTAEILCADIDSAQELLVSGGYDKSLRLWRLKTGEEIRAFYGHEKGVRCVAFAPQGDKFASAGDDGKVIVWSTKSDSPVKQLEGPEGYLRALQFSPDGTRLACGGDAGAIRLWDTKSNQQIIDIPAGSAVQALAFSPDGGFLLAGGPDSPAQVWNVETHQRVAKLAERVGRVLDLRFRDHSQLSILALKTESGARFRQDGAVERWEVHRRNDGCEVRARNALPRGTSGRLVGPEEVLVINSQRKSLHHFKQNVEQNRLSFADSPYCAVSTQEHLVVGFAGGWLEAFEKKSGDSLAQYRAAVEPVTALTFLDEGRVLVAGDWAGRVRTWRLDCVGAVSAQAAGDGPIRDLARGPEGILVGACWDDEIRTWMLTRSGSLLERFKQSANSPTSVVAFEDYRLVGGVDPPLLVQEGGANPRPLVASGSTINCLAKFNGGVVFGDTSGRLACLWGLAPARIVELYKHSSAVNSIAVDPDGEVVASASDDGRVVLSFPDSKRKSFELISTESEFWSTAFDSRGQVLAVGDSAGTVWLWQKRNGSWHLTEKLIGHSRGVTSVAFQPGTDLLASASADGTVRLRKTSTHQEVAQLFGLGETDWAVVDPEGRFDGSPPGMKAIHLVSGTEVVSLNQLKNRYFEPGLLQKLLGHRSETIRSVRPLRELGLHPKVEIIQAPKGDDSTLKLRLIPRGGGVGQIKVRVNGVETAVVTPQEGQTDVSLQLPKDRLEPKRDNIVETVAYSSDNTMASRAYPLTWVEPEVEKVVDRRLFLIAGGISDYENTNLRLSYPARDAIDLTKALTRGGKRYYGQDKVKAYLLTETAEGLEVTLEAPTRDGFERVFQEVAKESKPEDVLVLFLAGHGTNDGDLYAYLTKEAEMTENGIPEKGAITSDDLREWLGKIKANHRVVVLDTCSAAALADGLASSGGARAVNFLGSDQNLHLLMGCAADAQSFESASYGHGLLTYSLLLGLSGPALHKEEFADVLGLYRFAALEVQNIAPLGELKQVPMVAGTPSQNLIFASLSDDDRFEIAPTSAVPRVALPIFQGRDKLNLRKLLEERLLEAEKSGLLDLRYDQPPKSIVPYCRYTVKDETVELRLTLENGDDLKDLTFRETVSNVTSLVNSIYDSITNSKGDRE